MLRLLTAGESHGPMLTAILEGIPAGLALSLPDLNHDMARRQVSYGSGARMRIEKDQLRITAGVLAGKTTGAPLAILIENRDHASWHGKPIPPMNIPRPGHVDLTAALKYGYDDLRPGLERGSARETAARVAAGAICRQLLLSFDIRVVSLVLAIGNVVVPDRNPDLAAEVQTAESNPLRCPHPETVAAMKTEIQAAIKAGESLGGIIEVTGLNLPVGLGSHVHWDRRLSARLGQALFSIPAIKGVEIGAGFELGRLQGSRANDAITLQGSQIGRGSNHAGGIEGGITNGMPLILRLVMKPIPTTLTPQASVDLTKQENTLTAYERSDFCAVPRAAVVAEAMTCFVLADELLRKLGGDSMIEIKQRFNNLPSAHTDSFRLKNQAQIFWPADEE